MIIALAHYSYSGDPYIAPIVIGHDHAEAIILVDQWLESRNPDTDRLPESVSYWQRNDRGEFIQFDWAATQ